MPTANSRSFSSEAELTMFCNKHFTNLIKPWKIQQVKLPIHVAVSSFYLFLKIVPGLQGWHIFQVLNSQASNGIFQNYLKMYIWKT
jgi:hypothetical protein